MVQRDRSSKRGDRLPSSRPSVNRPEKLPRRFLESLEKRVFLSASLNNNLHDLQHGPMSNAGQNLLNLYLDYRSAQRNGTVHKFTKSATHANTSADLAVRGDTAGVEVLVIGDLATATKAFQANGMVVTSVDAKDNVVAGDYPITLLHELSIRPDVASVRPLSVPKLHSVGVANNQADATLKASLARNTYGVTGANVKVGVISDSVNQTGGGLADSAATGDLPAASAITVVSDGNGNGDTDEGRAMLEEIHDLAPGASLYFASADAGQQGFVTAINGLVNNGCKVIVDDVGFTDEPFFQPGIIDVAINNAIAAGVTFITAAGNNGDNGFTQAAHFVADPNNAGGSLINFNPSGAAATRMTITTTTRGEVDFQWDDAYNGVTGTVKADLDIYFYNAAGTTIVRSGTDNNFTTGVPVETINNLPAGTYQVEIRAKATTLTLPTYYGFTGDFTLTSTQYTGIRNSIIGHSAFSNAISIGAVPFYSAPPNSSAQPIPTETFSGQGPVIEARDANGVLLGSALTLNKPDLSGTDQSNTSFFGTDIPEDADTLPNFAGTSGAAGNVAGVIALIKSGFPNDTQSQILAALKASAVPLNGQAQGAFDPAGGYGLINAAAALAILNANNVIPLASIEPVIPNPTASPVDSIVVDFNEVVTGVDLSDFTLTLNNGPNLLLTGGPAITSSDGQHYTITNLANLTGKPGTYILTLRASGSAIAAGALALATDTSITWVNTSTVTAPLQPTKIQAVGISQGSVRITWRDNARNEDSYTIQRSTNPTFKNHTVSIGLVPNSTTYTIGRLAAGTAYYFRVFASNKGGNSLFSGTANGATYSRGEVVLDNSASKGVSFDGELTTSTVGTGFIGADYFTDTNTDKGHDTVTYTPSLLKRGDYFIYANWPRLKTNATKVPIDVFSSRGVLVQTVYVNQRSTGGTGWVLLGKFSLRAGAGASVRVRNKGTKGAVIADAFRFLPDTAIPGSNTSS